MVTFIALAVFAACQNGSLPGEGQQCSGKETVMYIKATQILEMEDFNYRHCTIARWDGTDRRYYFDKCKSNMDLGCKLTINNSGLDGYPRYTSAKCDKLKKVQL